MFVNYIVQLRQNLSDENVDILEQLFKQEGLIFVPQTVEELEAAIQDVREKTISALEQKIEKFRDVNIEVMSGQHFLELMVAPSYVSVLLLSAADESESCPTS